MRYTLILLCVLLFGVATMAQDVTPSQEVPIPTVEASPSPEPELTTGFSVSDVLQLLLAMATVLAVTGLSASMFLSKIMSDHNKTVLTLMEKLADSIPVNVRERANSIGEGLSLAGQLLSEATDGIPAKDKPSE